MKKLIVTSVLYTVVTAVLLGVVYPLAVTGLAHLFFPRQAEGSLIHRADGTLVGSQLIGQAFSGPGYFWSRPSAAGNGYDAGNSGGSNYAPTNSSAGDARAPGRCRRSTPRERMLPCPSIWRRRRRRGSTRTSRPQRRSIRWRAWPPSGM